jgi:acyl-CoA thioester hydrolase
MSAASHSAASAKPASPPPTPGGPGTEGRLSLRVRYCECDPMGVVHHASYWPWLEMGRTELLRQSGVSYAQLEAEGVFLVIVEIAGKYRRPGRYDDLLEVRTRWVGGSAVKIKHEYEVVRLEAGKGPGSVEPPAGGEPEVLMVASTTIACVGRNGRVRELPGWLKGTNG